MAVDKGGRRRPSSEFDKGRTVAMISAILMVFLTILKGSVGLIYGSVALQADAVNSFSDILASALVWSGLKLANRDPDKKFPFGYYRAETIASLIVAAMVSLTGLSIIWESIFSIFNPEPIRQALLPLVAAATSAAVYFLIGRYKRNVGEEIGSRALIADGAHSLADVWAGVIAFAGIFFSAAGFPHVEILVAIAIGAYILKEGAQLAKDAIFSLMDAAVDLENVKRIREVARGVEGVMGVHDVRLRRAGAVLFGEMHISVRKDLPLEHAHRISNIVDKRVCDAEPELESITIHIDPATRKGNRIAVPVSEDNGLFSEVSPHFARAPYILFVDVSDGTLENPTAIENPGVSADSKRGIETAQLILDQDAEILVTREIGAGPFGILMGELVTILEYPEGNRSLEEVVKLAYSDSLSPFENPSEPGKKHKRKQ
ncbi:cation diffusion facilitator family transporter [Candidatus Thorarchaeota archaeon]|nr:MAG: cation diffusion facilitator family transporter [Candidatus Thorarchaeota archaeon]